MRDLAKLVGVSDVALSKSLRAGKIPLPPQGYWNKLAAGHRVKKPTLAPPDLGTPLAVWVSGTLGTARLLFEGEPGHDQVEEDVDAMTARFEKRIGRMRLPASEHSEVTRIKVRTARRNSRWEGTSLAGHMRQELVGAVNERRLRLANSLLHASESFGEGGHLDYEHDKLAPSLRFGGFAVTLSIDATRDREPITITAETGQQRSRLVWRDDEKGKLESKLREIVVAAARQGVVSWQAHREDVRRWEEQARQEATAAKLEADRLETIRIDREREEKREARTKALLQASTDMHKAEHIREFVSAVRQRTGQTADIDDWSAWALEEADRIDPLKNGVLYQMIARDG